MRSAKNRARPRLFAAGGCPAGTALGPEAFRPRKERQGLCRMCGHARQRGPEYSRSERPLDHAKPFSVQAPSCINRSELWYLPRRLAPTR